jgi:glucose-6-phosphate dehydrogenase assembly protein OpcA
MGVAGQAVAEQAVAEQASAFLGGVPLAVDPTAIEQHLARLWKPAADSAGPGVQHPAVTRVALGTLVVVATEAQGAALEAECDTIAAGHPSRIVVVLVAERRRALAATVAASCHLATPGAPQVCSETIVLRAGPEHLERLPGVVLPLLLPDVPATVWWRLPQPPSADVAADLVARCERCLLDLTGTPEPCRVWHVCQQALPGAVLDLAWHRAAAWREAVAQLFDGGHTQAALAGIDAVEVVSAARGPAELLPAALLAGWVTGQLRWSPVTRLADGRSRWRRPDGGEAQVALRTAAPGDDRPGRLQALMLGATSLAGAWHIERRHDRVRELRVTAHCRDWCALPFSLPAPRPTAATVVLAALGTALDNPNRQRACGHAGWLLGWG